jgi:hypothetical protein
VPEELAAAAAAAPSLANLWQHDATANRVKQKPCLPLGKVDLQGAANQEKVGVRAVTLECELHSAGGAAKATRVHMGPP